MAPTTSTGSAERQRSGTGVSGCQVGIRVDPQRPKSRVACRVQRDVSNQRCDPAIRADNYFRSPSPGDTFRRVFPLDCQLATADSQQANEVIIE
ncbi:MAG: hypothetical protein KDI63_05790 [Gammaproteobacteria bacterium]|nr:hypothetical protein [Gammaproteobacteria bacterium]